MENIKITNSNDTIVGIATAIGGGINIIRISGDNAISILQKIFKTNKDVFSIESHTMNYGYIYDGDKKIDEVLVCIMKAPRSYTMEDVVEINCHGGVITTNNILNLIIKNGARLAENGEFTKIAFLNGRIDLTEAEAISDLIFAKTDKEASLAINSLSGMLKDEIEGYRQKLLDIFALIEVTIDYPEHDFSDEDFSNLKNRLFDISENIGKLTKTAFSGKIIKEGIETLIVGSPNVGKSSIINVLSKEDVSIVTNIAGTTRDIIEKNVNVNGILLKLIDTAGIRETEDIIEKIGIDKTLSKAKNADLILFVINANEEISDDELALLDSLKDKNIIIILNKTDLDIHADLGKIENYKIVKTSASNNDINELYLALEDMFLKGVIENDSTNIITNKRHEGLLLDAKTSIDTAITSIDNGFSIDFLTIDIDDAYKKLSEILGLNIDEEVLDKIFSDFCLGK